MKPSIPISLLLLFFAPMAYGQFLNKLGDKVVNTVEKTVEEKVEKKTEETVNNTMDKIDSSTKKENKENNKPKSDKSTPSNKKQENPSPKNPSYVAPEATTKISPPELIRWLDLKVGNKFKEPEDKNLKQVIAVNPYLSPENPFFGDLFGLSASPDGSLIVGATGGLDKEGGVKGIGWWKIAPDGAITSFNSRPYNSPHPGIYPSQNFSLTADGSLLTIFTEEINTNRIGTKVVKVHPNGQLDVLADGLEKPYMPIQDPNGNVWVANKEGTELFRISPDGTKSENLIENRSFSQKELAPQERITVELIAWDPVHNELVTAGSFITSKPHDLHSSVWRISPDGKAKRVFYVMKNGQTTSGQRTDAIRAITVDSKGQIVLATKMMNSQARRQIVRLNEKSGKLEVLTGQSYQSGPNDYRPGQEESPYDGAAAHANFRETFNISFDKDGTLFIQDAYQVRRLDKDGMVRTWGY